jgi:hypothetical protein
MFIAAVIGRKPIRGMAKRRLMRRMAEAAAGCEPLVQWQDVSRRLLVCVLDDDTERASVGSRVHLSEGGDLVAFTGWPWPRGGCFSTPWAEDLAHRLRGIDPTVASQGMFGIFRLLAASADGRATFTADAWHVGGWYRADPSPGLTVLSTDVAVAAALATDQPQPPRDAGGVSWLVSLGFLGATATPFTGVHRVPHGVVLRVRDGVVHQEAFEARPWLIPDGSNDLSELIDAAIAEMLGNVASLDATTLGARWASMTGGKDSRLMQALLREHGTLDRYEFFTRGQPEDRDVRAARKVAAHLGVAHRLDPKDQVHLDDDALLAAFQQHLRRMRGLVAPWDLRGGLPVDRLLVTGLWGEPMRSYYAGDLELSSAEDVARILLGPARIDPGKLLIDDVRDAHRTELRAWIEGEIDAGVRAEDVPDAFYMPYRLRRWIGAFEEDIEVVRAHPLQTLAGVRAAFAGGRGFRRRDGLHFEILARLAPDLLGLPLAGVRWDPANFASHPELQHLMDVEPVTEIQAIEVENWQDVRYPFVRQRLRESVWSDRSHPIFEVVDRSALGRLLDKEFPTSRAVRMRLYGVLGAAMWLGLEDQKVGREG